MKLLGRAQEKGFWSETVRNKLEFAKYRTELLKYWEKNDLENKRFEAMTYSEFKLFWTTGDRDVYQGQYFSRRTALEVTLPLALIYPEENKYLEKIMDWVYIICDEYTWCLPAHQGELDTLNEVRIDLFASECAFNLAVIYTLLHDRLDPLIRARIEYEISRRVIEPFLATKNYGWWELGRMNWTSVCIGSTACAAMLMRPELVTDAVIERFNKSMMTYLSGFENDGVCLEGCGYWSYGFGYYTQYADMVYRFTDGRVDLLHCDPKIVAIATFPQKMFLTGSAGVSFADGGRTMSYTTGILHRLKTEFPDDVLIYSPVYSRNTEGCGRLPVRMFSAAWMVEDYYNNPADNASFESFFEDAQWYVKRTEAYGFAAKAGNNEEFHNHNDVGSFIFAKAGRQLLCDLGSGKYTRQYFERETRYSIIECSSLGHSVPVINGEGQKFGGQYRATSVESGEGVFSMDIAGAYGIESLKSLRRRFELTEDTVTLTDEIDYRTEGSVTERLVSVVKPEIVRDGEITIGEAALSFDPQYGVSITETCGTASHDPLVYLIDFTLPEGVTRFEITMK